MKRSDDVFFFTLIDFLLQVFFFGLLLYVFSQAVQAKKDKEREHVEETSKDQAAAIKKLIELTGVSNLTELSDELTNLGPLNELKGTAEFIQRAGGADNVRAAVKAVEGMGGAQSANEKMAKLRKLEEGSGKPPCLFSETNGKKVARPLAVVTAQDDMIMFDSNNPDLETALRSINRSYESVRELPLAEFKRTFAALLTLKPECRYTLKFHEKTRLVYARDAARFAFYLSIEGAR